jgi:hypothetical protein
MILMYVSILIYLDVSYFAVRTSEAENGKCSIPDIYCSCAPGMNDQCGRGPLEASSSRRGSQTKSTVAVVHFFAFVLES